MVCGPLECATQGIDLISPIISQCSIRRRPILCLSGVICWMLTRLRIGFRAPSVDALCIKHPSIDGITNCNYNYNDLYLIYQRSISYKLQLPYLTFFAKLALHRFT